MVLHLQLLYLKILQKTIYFLHDFSAPLVSIHDVYFNLHQHC